MTSTIIRQAALALCSTFLLLCVMPGTAMADSDRRSMTVRVEVTADVHAIGGVDENGECLFDVEECSSQDMTLESDSTNVLPSSSATTETTSSGPVAESASTGPAPENLVIAGLDAQDRHDIIESLAARAGIDSPYN